MQYPTPYPYVNTFVDDLLVRVQPILGDQFVGLYFYGSLAYGDFTPGRSDIDFLVLTDREVAPAVVAALADMHRELASSSQPAGLHVEGVYLPRSALRRHDPEGPAVPTLNAEGEFYQAPLGVDWIFQRHLLRRHSAPIAGPPIRNLIDPVSPEELRSAAHQLMAGWWASRLEQPEWLQPAEYQAYTVLSMCRALHTLATGEVVSKGEAAAWALAHLDELWGDLIRAAVAWRAARPFDRLDEVLEFIRYSLSRAGILDPKE